MKKLINSIKKNLNSYRHAVRGISYTIGNENNFKYQLIAALVVIGTGLYIRLNVRDWIVLTTIIGVVLMAELFNTSIEKICDFVHPKNHPQIGIIKDISAGAVLVISIAALLIAVLIILNHYS